MTVHLEAKRGEYAKTVLLPGCPLRARFVAETFLSDLRCVNEVRNALGFTGRYQGRLVSVQSTGMGMPSMAIYAHELLNEYGCQNLIRIGTCGGLPENVAVGDLVLAMAASTDSSFHRNVFDGKDYAPTAAYDLLRKAHDVANA